MHDFAEETCLSGCSDHGSCIGDAICLCKEGYIGLDCSYFQMQIAINYEYSFDIYNDDGLLLNIEDVPHEELTLNVTDSNGSYRLYAKFYSDDSDLATVIPSDLNYDFIMSK